MPLLKWYFPSEHWKPKNSGCDVACESPRSFQFERPWLLSEDLTTIYQSFLTVRNWTNSLLAKSSRYWRTKFDLDGYFPTEFTKEQFMTECEAIERNEPKLHQKTKNSTVSGKTVTHKKRYGVKFRSATLKSDTTAKFYCTEHGQNPSYPTDKGYTLFEKPCGEGRRSFKPRLN
jgi:hypothetical protein